MRLSAFILLQLLFAAIAGADALAECERRQYEGNHWIVCRFDAARDEISLRWAGEDGKPLYTFSALRAALEREGRELVFAMNAGMFDPQYRPAGLYVENGRRIRALNTRRGKGNFHLMPNGVFWISGRRAGVTETSDFKRLRLRPRYATQSGPMLVISGRIHPRFRRDSDSRKLRNGVGVSKDGRTVWFAISEGLVNFHAFARLFRDHLKTPNALFLDGGISQICAPDLGRCSSWFSMGPMVVVSKKSK